jgi:hypothetical protein
LSRVKRYSIEKTNTMAGLLQGVVFTWLISMFLLAIFFGSAPSVYYPLIAFIIAIARASFYYIRSNLRLKRHQKQIESYSETHNITLLKNDTAHFSTLGEFNKMSLRKINQAREPKLNNILQTPEWSYGELAYKKYRKTKHGEYHALTFYYAVMSVELPRELPHVFFDSLRARKRQFRFHFSRDQLISLEGNFDKYFAAYCPDGYTIDFLSFISPDVMLSLIDAKDYDVEVVGNRLFLYSSLKDPFAQIEDMHTKIATIKKQLLDNILTYRDERLPAEIGRKTVSISGVRLKRSRFWQIVAAIWTLIIIIGYIFIMTQT